MRYQRRAALRTPIFRRHMLMLIIRRRCHTRLLPLTPALWRVRRGNVTPYARYDAIAMLLHY